MFDTISSIYQRLWQALGPQHWWPISGKNPSKESTNVEIVVGAILTQNTSWKNVERAIGQLHQANVMSWKALREVSSEDLAELIRPAGTFRVKTKRIKALVDHLFLHHQGGLVGWLDGDLHACREELLSIHGIGPETADAILLYAAHRATFVIDAYTKRILRRHHIIQGGDSYDSVQIRFHESLKPDPRVYNEFHALLVELGKRHCRSKARCDGCPLADIPHDETL